jgi:glutathione S-transferase
MSMNNSTLSSKQTPPILYSFRRCPYAMRARLAIAYANVAVELREVELRNKPQAMLLISPKGTVPVLQLGNGKVLDESLDIMLWALQQNDPEHWLKAASLNDAQALIRGNDESFKYFLDRYKYADRYPAYSELYYRQQAELFLVDLEGLLTQRAYLCGEHFSLADAAILPFIRQFCAVDPAWFKDSPYPALRQWLNQFLASSLFKQVMTKHPCWQAC